MLAFSIAPDACNGIEYYTFLRRAYTKGIPFLSNTKLNIRKYFPEKRKKKQFLFLATDLWNLTYWFEVEKSISCKLHTELLV